LLSTSPLKTKDINIAKRLGIRRCYLPKLSKAESERFFIEFDRLWDSAIKPFDNCHPFWRNAISSKMQEWERSFTYLLLILYTLSKINNDDSLTIVIVCSSLQEEELCEEWGRKSGWKTIRNPSVRISYQLRYSLQRFKLFLKFQYILLLFLFQKFISPKYKKLKIKNDNFVLISSLIYSKSIKGGEFSDPFFGDLYKYYNRFGKTVINLCHPLDNYKKTVGKLSECKAANIVAPLSLIRWNEVISIAFRVFFRKILFNRVKFFDCNISKLIHWNAHHEIFFNLHAELYYCAIKKLCRFYGFALLIFPYEGNAFERACIQAFRKYSSGTIIGYSHAVIYPLNVKIRLTEAEKSQRPTPDFFIATGPENKRLMVETGNHDEESIQTACALRNIPNLGKLCSSKNKNSTILIALDGVWSTAVVLNWFLENASILNEYDFIIRSHPNIPVGKLIEQCLYNIPENFSFSTTDLKSDFEKCFCIVYRQTSVGLQALMNGIPAIHLNIDSPLPCDPIENLRAGKLVVSDTNQLLSAIKEIKSLSEESCLQAMNEAKKYALEYFCERTDENINVFLKENV
jgi:hypothetical protein